MPNDPRNRLEELCRMRGVEFVTLSRLVGRNDAYIQQYIRRGSPKRLGERERKLIADYFDVDEGELGAPRAAPPGGRRLVGISQRPVRAAAGAGQLPEDEQASASIAFDRAWLKRLTPSASDKLSIIQVEGDSMAPTLVNGDDILVDEGDCHDRLRDGIYVLRVDGALMVKRLALNPMGRKVTIQSDNPAYADWPDVPLADIECIGRVIWAGGRVS